MHVDMMQMRDVMQKHINILANNILASGLTGKSPRPHALGLSGKGQG